MVEKMKAYTDSELKSRVIDVDSMRGAQRIIATHLSPTACRGYGRLSERIGAEVYVKHENHNPTATFKIRGGLNVMHNIRESSYSGVITFSTGNHGTSVALAARLYGLPAVVVVPEGTNPAKTRAIEEAGAELICFGKTFEDAETRVEELVRDRALYFVHPANEPELINGVGTCFLEILDQVPDVDVVIVPLGAGSEVASAITVFRKLRPSVEVIAVQAKASSAAYASWRAGAICSAPNNTFAGGFATGRAYQTTFETYKDSLSDFVLLEEDELIEAMALAMHYTSNLAEAAGAAPIRAAEKLRVKLAGKTVVLQMSGGKAEHAQLTAAVNHPRIGSG